MMTALLNCQLDFEKLKPADSQLVSLAHEHAKYEDIIAEFTETEEYLTDRSGAGDNELTRLLAIQRNFVEQALDIQPGGAFGILAIQAMSAYDFEATKWKDQDSTMEQANMQSALYAKRILSGVPLEPVAKIRELEAS